MLRFVFAVLCSAVLFGAAFAQTNSTLEIEGEDGTTTHAFNIEIVDTPELLERGLMERETLDASSGMLFDYGVSTEVSMWMKNTPLSLDMLFINESGHVVAIARNTVPQSERRLSPGSRVRAVLELNAGTTKSLNIEPGALVRHSLFGSEKPAPIEGE